MPCKSARARKLLSTGKAAVFRRYPFTIILKDRAGGDAQLLAIKIDPGSKTTGISLNAEFVQGSTSVFGAHIQHRGDQIKEALAGRRAIRGGRRSRKTRYVPLAF